MSPRSSGASPRRRGRAQPTARTPTVGDDSIRLLRPEPAEASSVPNSERVYRGLRDQILSGALVANARLVEVQLASQFAVSRTPVREALKRLAAEGLVSADPLRGMVVRDVDSAEIEDIYVIREALEGLAARLAAERATASDLAKLRLLMELMQESAAARRWEAVVQINVKFHEVLYAASGNERLALIGRSLEDAVRRFSAMVFSDPGRVAGVLREHEEIVRALEAHDPAQAEASSRGHLCAARGNFSRHFATEPAS